MVISCKENPLISIIIPVYNVEKYLDKCIKSVVNQNYKNLEILLVDDGSQDLSPQICENWKLKDERIQILYKENGGQGSARNIALDVAKGEFIAFVDSDDYIDANMIEIMVHEALEYQADLVICGMHIDNGIRVIDVAKPNKKRIYQSARDLLKDYVSKDWIFTGPCNKLYRKELFEKIRFPVIRCNEDAYIMHEILGKCKCAVHTSQCLYTQYLREGSTEKSAFSEKNMVLIRCAERLRDYIGKNFPDLYQLVLFKPAEDTVNLMKKIVCKHTYHLNISFYNKLERKLQNEISFLLEKCNNAERIKILQAILKFKCYYLLCWEIKGYISDVKKLVKYVLIKIKR